MDKTKDLTPYRRWEIEIKAAKVRQGTFWKEGGSVVSRFRDDRKNTGEAPKANAGDTPFRLNLFHANISTMMAMMYGKIPETDVGRRWADPDDDVARIASEVLRRILDTSIQEPGSADVDLLRHVLRDRLLPGLAAARVRYDFQSEEVPGPPDEEGNPTTQTQVTEESAPLEYVHWRDLLWGYGRIWADVSWVGYRVYMDREQVVERFGEGVAGQVNFNKKPVGTEDEEQVEDEKEETWYQTELIEIWDKSTRQVVWWSADHDQLLDTKPDPLGLKGFFPSPPPLMANLTTDLVLPRSDFVIAQDLYNQIDVLQTRIGIITKAVKVVGVYDENSEGITRMFQEAVENDLIPVSNWAMFAEKGGLNSQIDWLPVGEMVEALTKLQELRDQTIQLLYQVTGMADILRGSSGQYTAAATDQLKAKFASIRVQHLQDEFGTFVSGLMDLRAEVIRNHFEPSSIFVQSNAALLMEDPQAIEQAIDLIKQPGNNILWKVEIKPESIALVDYAQVKAERTEYLVAVATFLQSAYAAGERAPELVPMMLEMLKWGMAGFKGSQQIEGTMDRGIKAMVEKLENPPEEPENPKIMEMQVKHQAEMQKQEKKSQDDMNKLLASHVAKLREITAAQSADAQAEALQAYFNIMEVDAKKEADLAVKRLEGQNRRVGND